MSHLYFKCLFLDRGTRFILFVLGAFSVVGSCYTHVRVGRHNNTFDWTLQCRYLARHNDDHTYGHILNIDSSASSLSIWVFGITSRFNTQGRLSFSMIRCRNRWVFGGFAWWASISSKSHLIGAKSKSYFCWAMISGWNVGSHYYRHYWLTSCCFLLKKACWRISWHLLYANLIWLVPI